MPENQIQGKGQAGQQGQGLEPFTPRPGPRQQQMPAQPEHAKEHAIKAHQIRMQADRLLGSGVTDVDGNSENRSDTVSIFNGPPPIIRSFGSETQEIQAVSTWISERSEAGIVPHEFGVIVRSDGQMDRARAAVAGAGLDFRVLDEHVDAVSGHVAISTMHLAKGLEFRAVVVMACDDEIIPLQGRIETVGDDADLQEVYDTERQLLYVACTRARDQLLVTSTEPASEFLNDMLTPAAVPNTKGSAEDD